MNDVSCFYELRCTLQVLDEVGADMRARVRTCDFTSKLHLVDLAGETKGWKMVLLHPAKNRARDIECKEQNARSFPKCSRPCFPPVPHRHSLMAWPPG
jgi:hypothetical protein